MPRPSFPHPAAGLAAALLIAATQAQATSLWTFSVSGTISGVTKYTSSVEGADSETLGAALGYSVGDAVEAYATYDADLAPVLPPQILGAYRGNLIVELGVKAGGAVVFETTTFSSNTIYTGGFAPPQTATRLMFTGGFEDGDLTDYAFSYFADGDSEFVTSKTAIPPVFDLNHATSVSAMFRIDPEDPNEEAPGDVWYQFELALGPLYGLTMTEGDGGFPPEAGPVATPLPAAAPLLAVGALALAGVAHRRRG